MEPTPEQMLSWAEGGLIGDTSDPEPPPERVHFGGPDFTPPNLSYVLDLEDD